MLPPVPMAKARPAPARTRPLFLREIAG